MSTPTPRLSDTFYTRSGLSPPPTKWRGDPALWPSLSVKDPWIGLIGDGRKPFEIRKRVTHYRGPVVLCSSVNPARTEHARSTRVSYARRGRLWTPGPLGCALFVGDLVDCRLAVRDDWKGACGYPEAGTYVWHFRNVRPMPKPMPVSGKLGLYVTARAVLLAAKRARK